MLKLNIPFKGNRPYLNGASFFDEITKLVAEIESLKNFYLHRIIFRRFTDSICFLSLIRPQNSSKVVGEGDLVYADQNLKTHFWVVESEFKTLKREAYDEDRIINNSVIDLATKSIGLKIEEDLGTGIEVIVALTKLLHNSLAPTKNGKWLFVQIELNKKLPSFFSSIEVRIDSMIGSRFSQSLIILDDIRIGMIKFAVGQ